jgi:hypothetical protein
MPMGMSILGLVLPKDEWRREPGSANVSKSARGRLAPCGHAPGSLTRGANHPEIEVGCRDMCKKYEGGPRLGQCGLDSCGWSD